MQCITESGCRAALGPGEMNTGVDEGVGWWSSCQNAKG
jgi:hypothetical protein